VQHRENVEFEGTTVADDLTGFGLEDENGDAISMEEESYDDYSDEE
jgi:hypothetical protein